MARKGATKTIDPLTRRDARGRELSHTWSDATPGITRTWDDAGHVTSLTNNFSTIGYTYDQAGQVRTENNTVAGAGGTTTLTTNRYPDGTPATLTYPNGFKLRRDYTARGQLLKAGSADSNGNWLTQFVTYNYRADGDVNYEDYGNGVRTAFGYDARGFTNLVNTYRLSPVQTYSNRTYYRDTRDRIFAWKKSTNISANPMEDGRGDRYTYDAEGQLTAASYQALTPDTTPTGAQRTESFVFDQLGNRKGVNTIAGRGNVTFARRDTGVNQYLNWTPPMASTNYETNGVLTQEGYITATYNALNQPISISSPALPAGTLTWFGYDPLGRCVKRWNGASGTPASNPATYFYYDGCNLIQEGANSSTAGRIYAHGTRVDEIVASQAGGQWAYHHYDARSHCILLTNASGGLLEQYDYDAFGKPYFYNASGISQTSSGWGNRFLFTGREWLSDLKVYDFRNRHYLPELGRFIQPDPKEFEAGDYNLYRYCHNDPVNKTDPLGLSISQVNDEYTKVKDVTHWEFTTASRIPEIVPDAPSSNLAMAQRKQTATQPTGAPPVSPTLIREGMTATDRSVQAMEKTGKPHSVVSYTDREGHQAYTEPQPGTLKTVIGKTESWTETIRLPAGATARIDGHSHKEGSSSFSRFDQDQAKTIPVMKNRDGGGQSGRYDMLYQGWRFYIDRNGEIVGHPFRYP